MSAGVSPWEWVIPIVGATHTAYNVAAQQVSPNAKFVVQGSKAERTRANDRHNQEVLGEQHAQAAVRAEELRYNTTPQSAAEQLQSKQRAKLARATLGGSASQQLTSATLG
jgi:hypothetical protein